MKFSPSPDRPEDGGAHGDGMGCRQARVDPPRLKVRAGSTSMGSVKKLGWSVTAPKPKGGNW